jgi:putative serine-aspartate-rich surface anchored fibrinogen-binding protein
MTKENKNKEFLRNKETINIKEFMLQKSGEQDKLITDTLDKIYEGNVEVTKKHLEKVLNVAFDNKDNETYLPHSLCVKKDGNKLIFAFKKKNTALIILFLLGFLFIAGFATFTGVQFLAKEKLNIDLNGDGIADLNIDLDDDGLCDINCDTNDDGKPDKNIDYRGNRKPTFNVLVENKDTLFNEMNQMDEKGKCKLNCDTNNDGWPDTNIDIDGDGKADLNIDIDNNGLPDLNIDTNGDGVADINIDDDGDGKCDRLCASVSDNKGGMTTIGGGNVNIDTAALIVAFESGDDINISNLYPDDQNDPDVNTTVPDVKFTIINTTSKALHYNLDWINVENTFTSGNFMTKIFGDNGGYKADWASAPTTNNRFANNIEIPAYTTQNYVLSFKLRGIGTEQNFDQGKIFKGRVAVDIIEDNNK